MKRSIFTSILLLSIVCLQAATTFTVEGIKYTTTGISTCSVSSGGTYSGDVIIPSSVSDGGIAYSVTGVAAAAFNNCTSMTSVNLPSTVSAIGSLAFNGCSGLSLIILGNSTPPSLGTTVFAGVTTGSCTICVPKNSKFTYNGTAQWNTFTNISENLLFTINGIRYLAYGNNSVSIQPTGNYSGSIIIPSSVIYNETTYAVDSIGIASFSGSASLTSVVIPNTVSNIGERAFYNCYQLASINIPSSVTAIGMSTFENCVSLKSITIPNSITTIKQNAFYNCQGLTNISLPSSITSLSGGAFGSCTAIESIYTSKITPPSMLDDYAGRLVFQNLNSSNCTLVVPANSKNAYLADNQWKLFTNMLEQGSSGIIFIVDSIKYISTGATSCSVKSASVHARTINIPSKVTNNETEYTVTGIVETAFNNYTNLQEITLPASLTSIGDLAFNNCSSLSIVTINASTPPSLGVMVFNSANNTNCSLFVLPNLKSTYLGAEQWQDFVNIIEIGVPINGIVVGKYYFIQGTRPTDTYITSSDELAMPVKNTVLTLGNEQLWRFMPNGGGYVLQNKKTGNYINTDIGSAMSLFTSATLPTKPIYWLSGQMDNLLNMRRYFVENIINATLPNVSFRIHAGGSLNNFELMNWTGDQNDNCSWLFIDETQIKTVRIKSLISKVQGIYDQTASMQGSTYGLYPAIARTNLNVALVNANSNDLTACTEQQLQSIYDNLSSAFEALKLARVNDINTIISTSLNPKYFVVTGSTSASAAYNKAIADVSTSAVTGTAKGIAINALETSQQWRFEQNGDGTIRMINAKNLKPIGIYGQANSNSYPYSQPTNILLTLHADEFSTVLSYQNFGTTEYFHTDANSTIVGWYDLTSTASAWKIMSIESPQLKVLQINALKSQMETAYQTSANMVGSTYGLYPTSARTDLNTAINNLNSVDLNASTELDLQIIYSDLLAAFNAFKYKRISDISSIVSTQSNPTHFYIRPTTINTRTAGRSLSNLSGVLNADILSENDSRQMWRFELNGDGTSVRMINTQSQTEVSIGGQGVMSYVNRPTGQGTWLTLGMHGDGCSSTLSYLNASTREYLNTMRTTYNICGWNDVTDLASGWMIIPVPASGDPNETAKVCLNSADIRVVNAQIIINSVKDFDIYNLTGQHFAKNAVLDKGIYLVKVQRNVFKVVVK